MHRVGCFEDIKLENNMILCVTSCHVVNWLNQDIYHAPSQHPVSFHKIDYVLLESIFRDKTDVQLFYLFDSKSIAKNHRHISLIRRERS
jgi:hypothetical protein